MSWHFETLGDLCEFENGDRGSNYPSKDKLVKQGLPFVNAGHINDGNINFRDMNYITKEHFKKLSRGKYRFGDVLFCLRGSLGKFAKVETNESGAIASSLVILRPSQRLLVDYLLCYFRSRLCVKMIKKFAGGAAQPNLGAKDLAKFEIPVPPLVEQKQIVTILDEAFANIDRARQLAERNLKNARELFDSTLNQIFTENDDGWITNNLKNLTTKIGSGATPRGGKESYKDTGIPLIRSLNVHNRTFRKKDLAFLDDAQASKLDNVIVQSGDVLLNITGASVARCCVAPDEYLPARVNQHVSIIRPKPDQLLPEFLNYLLTSKHYKDQLLGIGEAGSTRQAITKAQVESFVLSYPVSLIEQQSIAEKVRHLQQLTEKLELIYQQKITVLDELKQSMLQKAFRGELTQGQAA